MQVTKSILLILFALITISIGVKFFDSSTINAKTPSLVLTTDYVEIEVNTVFVPGLYVLHGDYDEIIHPEVNVSQIGEIETYYIVRLGDQEIKVPLLVKIIDTEPPEFLVKQEVIKIKQNEEIDLSLFFNVYDNSESDVKLFLDQDIDTSFIQEINAIIYAIDKSGNKSSLEVRVIVVAADDKQLESEFKDITRTEIIRFSTSSTNDVNFEKGKEVVKVKGVDGVRTIVERVEYLDGEEVSRKVVSNSITKEPINQVIVIGTKEKIVEFKDITRTEIIRFSTSSTNDVNLEKGKEVVRVEGVDGVRTIVERVEYHDGVEFDRTWLSDSISKEPINQVIAFGVKPPVEWKTQVFNLVNLEREKAGVPLLKYNSNLQNGVDIRAAELTISYSHTRPNGSRWFTAFENLLGCSGENIAHGYTSPNDVMSAWMNSEGHKRNILNDGHTNMAVGIDVDEAGRYYWVQIFSKSP